MYLAFSDDSDLDDDSDTKREEVDYEDDPAKILWEIGGLPPYPKPEGEENHTNDAAFIVASGPACLIQEVLLPPAPADECPILVYDKLEEARICQNAGQYEGSLRRLMEAYHIWSDTTLWRPLNQGLNLDEIAELRVAEARAKEERARMRKEREEWEIGNRLKQVEKALERERKMKEALENEEEYEEEDEDEEEPDPNEPPIISDSEEEPEPPPQLSPETKMEFEVFIWNCVGGVYQSQAEDTKAVINFWRAKSSHDVYVSSVHHVPSASDLNKRILSGDAANSREATRLLKQQREQAQQDGVEDVKSKDSASAAPPSESKKDTPNVPNLGNVEALVDAKGNPIGQPVNPEDMELAALTSRTTLSITMEDVLGYKVLEGDRPELKDKNPADISTFRGACPATAVTYSNLGSACYHLKRYKLALRCYYAAQQIRFQCLDEESDEYVDIASTLNNIGVCLHALKRFQEAFKYFLSAEELMTERLDMIHPRINVVKNNLEKVRPRRKKITIPNAIVDQVANKRIPKVNLGSWNVGISEYEKLLIQFGKAKKGKKKGKGKGKGKGKKKKKTKKRR